MTSDEKNNCVFVQSILWRRLDVAGHDACALWKLENSWRLSGTALFEHEHLPCRLSYDVVCDASWRAHAGTVTGHVGQDVVNLAIDLSSTGKWRVNGVEQLSAAACPDLDLAFTPATNLFALRRLKLAIGDSAPARAAWLDFPKPELVELRQKYKRIASTRYNYAAPSVPYQGQLEVTEAGFVTEYPGLWSAQALS